MLPNTTERIPNDEDHFVVSLDIFHQLHCLVRFPIIVYNNFFIELTVRRNFRTTYAKR